MAQALNQYFVESVTTRDQSFTVQQSNAYTFNTSEPPLVQRPVFETEVAKVVASLMSLRLRKSMMWTHTC